jgi:hypothetical protein
MRANQSKKREKKRKKTGAQLVLQLNYNSPS